MVKQIEIFMNAIEQYIDTNSINIVYDIGAGSCEETLELRNIFTNAEVYAFECNPACIYNCAKNIVNLDRITFLPICVNNYTGLVKFHPINQEKTITDRELHPDGNPKASSIYIANGTYPNETYVQDEITIPCMKIIDMIKLFDLPLPEIIWMDLQGAELPALQGIVDLSSVKIIHTEVTNEAMYTGQSLYPKIRKHLEDNNFICINVPLDDNWRQLDLDFVRRDIYEMNFKNKFQSKYHEYFSWEQLKASKGNDPLNIEIAKKNLLLLKRIFDEHDLKFWLIFGTALGAYRDGNFIPYDNDIDIAIFITDKDKLFDITDALIEKGLIPLRIFTEDWPKPTGAISGISYNREEEYIDVCFFKKTDDKYWCLNHWAELYQFDKLDTIKFLDEDFKIPSDIENYFVGRYGEDWKTHIKEKQAMA